MFKRKLLTSKAHDQFMESRNKSSNRTQYSVRIPMIQMWECDLEVTCEKDGSWGQLYQSNVNSYLQIS